MRSVNGGWKLTTPAGLTAIAIGDFVLMPYLTDQGPIAPSSTTALGLTGGKKGDVLDYLLLVAATKDMGAVSIKDGTDAAIVVYTGVAAGSPIFVMDGVPTRVPLGLRSKTGGWSIITGSGVRVEAHGRFS